MVSNPERQPSQMGMRLAFVSAPPHTRHCAGKSTEESASSAPFKITDALLTDRVR
jgi:hypothetical protein